MNFYLQKGGERLIKSRWLKRWLAMSLSALLVLTMAPGVFAAQTDGSVHKVPILERVSDSSQLTAAKIDQELSSQFKNDKYVTYLVKMSEQVDTEKVAEQARALSGNKAIPAAIKLAKAEAVVSALLETSLRTQSSLSKYLEKMQATGEVQKFESFYIVNGMSVTSTKEVMEKVASFAEVEKIFPNRTHTLDVVRGIATATVQQDNQLTNVGWNIEQVMAPQAWAMGIDGSGIVVASMDSGVQLNHPALQRKWRGNDVADWRMSWFDPFSSSTSPIDPHSHGTHTMGTLVGSEANGSNQIGVAPGAKWISARIFDAAGSTTDERILQGGEWILAPKDAEGNPHPEYRPDVVNNSWGGVPPGMDEWFRPMVQSWRAAGIFPEFSAGNTKPPYNNGGPGSITSPANYPESFATAAVNRDSQLASFSLRGPTPEYNEMKPDISAPGVSVRSSVPSGGYESDGWNGTSMAGPHVTGAVALMLQANASLEIADIERILRDTAVPLTDHEYPQSPNYGYGWGLLDVYAAVSAVADGLGTLSGNISIAGNDNEAPVIEHSPITNAYSGSDIPLSLRVSDNVSITSVEGFARTVGDVSWTVLTMQRTSGDYKDAVYTTVIPAYQLSTAGVEYYFSVNDYGNNAIQSEIYEIAISNGVTPGYFQDFENDANGFESGGTNNTWQWGVPASGPGSAFSGEKVIATNLAGDYSNNSNSYMQMPPIDLTEVEDIAYLTFMHWYNTENNYDKVSVHIASDNSDGEFVKILEFTAESQGWKKQFIDLEPYLGQQIHLRFYLTTDGSSTRPGWYIDDLALLGADDIAPAVPQNLDASTNAIGQVTLTWDRVMDPDMKDYVIYRSEESSTNFEEAGTSATTSFTETLDSGTYYYKIKARDYSNNLSEFSDEVAVTVYVPSIVYFDSFDGEDDNGWTHGGTNDKWQRGVPTSGPMSAVSAPNVWATNLSGNYDNSSANYLVSPVIDLKTVNNATLTFDHWYELETNYDKGFVEITKDSGNNWTELAVFSHTTNGMKWDQAVLNLTPHVGNDVQIRFRLTSDGSVNKQGWYIDNFFIMSATAPESAVTIGDSIGELKAEKPVEPVADKLQRTMNKSIYSTISTGNIQPAALPIGATVTVVETGRSTKSDPATGSYSMVHGSGEYTLRAEAYGYYPSTQSVTVVTDEVATVNFTLDPLPTGFLTGTVTDERSGEAIAGATLVLSDPRIAPITSDANGAFSLTALAGHYTLTVLADGYTGTTVDVTIHGNEASTISVQLKPFIGFEGIIGYDDGSAEDAVALNVPGGFGVRMTPEYQTAQVEGALLRYWTTDWPSPGGTAIQVAVYDVGSDGMPGKAISDVINAIAKRDGTWTEVNFENPVTVQGDFYLVYLQVGLNPNVPGIGLDEDSSNAFRSFMLANGEWGALPADYGNLMMRAKVKYPVGAPVIIAPANGFYTNDDNVTVTVISQAEGSIMNLYNDEEVVGTGTVSNGKVDIDITLHDGENRLSAEAMVDGKRSDRSAVVVVTLDQEAPGLEVTSPENGYKSNQETLHVIGNVSDEHLDKLFVNDQEANVNVDGSFDHRVFLDQGENVITVKAIDKAGNETIVVRTVDANFAAAFEITNIQPAADLHVKGGDKITVSFDSIEGLDASFKIELDLRLNNGRGVKMTETTPGHYEGSWITPTNLSVEKAIIAISATSAYGTKVEAEAPGRLYVTPGNGEGGPVNITVISTKGQVNKGEAFAIDIDFSQVVDLYAVQFSLTYDSALTKGSVEPSRELAAHLESGSLIRDEKVTDLGNGKVRSDYLLSLVGDIAGYDGTGSLATYNFSSAVVGDFSFDISNVRLLDSTGADIEVGTLTSTMVKVTDTPAGGFDITGQITAEALAEADYSEVWYSGEDGVHKITVEALNGEGNVVAVGAVNADGTYRLKVREQGSYTIRVVVPGHFEASDTVNIVGNLELNFGPLTAGDVNSDGVIDLVDLQQAAKAFGKNTSSFDYKSAAADLNRNGEVDMLDISYILNNFGQRK